MEYLRWLVPECEHNIFFVFRLRTLGGQTFHIYRFPLFSKGVDTYRFEYGVFLLNKDIEMVGMLFHV